MNRKTAPPGAGFGTTGAGLSASSFGAGGDNQGFIGSTTYSLGTNADWQIDVWGQIRRQVESQVAAAQVSDADLAGIEQHIRDAIMRFEPRIIPDTLVVRVMNAEERARNTANTVGFEIRGTLWATPLPELFQVKTEINLENGECVF